MGVVPSKDMLGMGSVLPLQNIMVHHRQPHLIQVTSGSIWRTPVIAPRSPHVCFFFFYLTQGYHLQFLHRREETLFSVVIDLLRIYKIKKVKWGKLTKKPNVSICTTQHLYCLHSCPKPPSSFLSKCCHISACCSKKTAEEGQRGESCALFI